MFFFLVNLLSGAIITINQFRNILCPLRSLLFIYINPIPDLFSTEIQMPFLGILYGESHDTPWLSKHVPLVKSFHFVMPHFPPNNHTYTSQSYCKK